MRRIACQYANPAARVRLAAGVVILAAIAGAGFLTLGSGQSLSASTALAAAVRVAETAPMSFAEVVRKVSPAVVTIRVTRSVAATAQGPGQGRPDEFFRRFFEDRRFFGDDGRRAVPPAPRQGGALGSGFIVDPQGFVVTNNHVVDGADEITVVLASGSELDATVVGTDPKTDLALLKVASASAPADGLPFVSWAKTDETHVGDWVVAIGAPFGLEHSVTVGVVSAKDRSIGAGPYDSFLQIDAPINRGNSGGPAFNLEGEVVGVNSAIFSPTGGNVGIGFAIPASIADDIIADLRDHGTVRRGFLGVNIQGVSADIAASLGLAEPVGAIVSAVIADGPAAGADIEVGDVIVSVDGMPVNTARDLPRLVAALKAGEAAAFTVLRDGSELHLQVVIGRQADAPGRVATAPSADDTVLGMRLAAMAENERQALGLSREARGVVIREVVPGSPAADKGLQAGDVIVSVGRARVVQPADVVAGIDAAKTQDRKAVLLRVTRQEQDRLIGLPLASA